MIYSQKSLLACKGHELPHLLGGMFDFQRILKALLFSSNEPLSIKDVQAVIARYHHQLEEDMAMQAEESEDGAASVSDGAGQGVMHDLLEQVPSLLTSAQIRDAMDSIAADMEEHNSEYRLQEGPNGYRLVVCPSLSDWVRLLRDEPRPQRLSPAQMETLAVVAYRQPVTRAELEAIRGVSSDSALNKLMERDLVYVVGRADLPGRPIQYGSTDGFLEFCGLRSIEELPSSDVLSPNQISEWIREATKPTAKPTDKDVGLMEGEHTDETEAITEVEDRPEAEEASDDTEV